MTDSEESDFTDSDSNDSSYQSTSDSSSSDGEDESITETDRDNDDGQATADHREKEQTVPATVCSQVEPGAWSPSGRRPDGTQHTTGRVRTHPKETLKKLRFHTNYPELATMRPK